MKSDRNIDIADIAKDFRERARLALASLITGFLAGAMCFTVMSEEELATRLTVFALCLFSLASAVFHFLRCQRLERTFWNIQRTETLEIVRNFTAPISRLIDDFFNGEALDHTQLTEIWSTLEISHDWCQGRESMHSLVGKFRPAMGAVNPHLYHDGLSVTQANSARPLISALLQEHKRIANRQAKLASLTWQNLSNIL